MEREKKVLNKDAAEQIVFDYVPKQFPIVVTSSAEAFTSDQKFQSKGFMVSELVSKQTGIFDLERKKIERRVEEEALERLKVIEEKAYREAYNLGMIEGAQKAFEEQKAEFEQGIKQISEVLEDIEKLRERVLLENENHLLRLVALVAAKIAMKEFETHPEMILDVLRQVMNDIQADDRCTIYMSVNDLMLVESVKEKLGKNWDFLRRVKLEPREDIQSGGCIIETTFGTIDATLEKRLEKVWSAFQSKLPRIRTEGQGVEPEASEVAKDPEAEAQADRDVKKDDKS